MEDIGQILPAVFRKRGQLRGATLVQILGPLWGRVAGKPMAQQSRPVAFEAGTLTLETDCPSWAGQLRQMSEEVRARVNAFLEVPVVKRVRVRRRESFEPAGVPPRSQEALPSLALDRPDAESLARLEPELARLVERSFSKYFARKGPR